MKMTTRSRFTTKTIVLVGLMSALVLIFSGMRIMVPIPVDNAAIQAGKSDRGSPAFCWALWADWPGPSARPCMT